MDANASFKVIGDGTAKCATPGTAVQLSASSLGIRELHISAFQENAGPVVLGSSTVVATVGSRRGRALSPGETIVLRVQDLNLVYLDALNAGDGISYAYLKVSA